MVEQALSNVKVLDLTQYVSGPYCTKLLADYGADVIKIEKPGKGDGARRLGPFYNDVAHPERSGLFLHLNTNKKSITLNLKTETGRKIFKDLVGEVDILVENFRPHVMPGLGLAYEALAEINPTLVMTSITNFGQTGPYSEYKASDIILFGMGGDMCGSGLPDREPVKHALNVVLYQAGAIAAPATAAGFYAARFKDLGQHIDISIMEALAHGIDLRSTNLVAYAYTGEVNPRFPENWMGYPAGTWPCKDGYFRITGGYQFWDRVSNMINDPEFLGDPKWKEPTAQSDPLLKEEFEAYFIGWLMQYTKKELWKMGQEAGLACSPLYTIEELLEDSHFDGRKVFEKIDHPETGELTYPGRPFIMSETPWEIRHPAPLLGQHNGEVYGNLGYSRQDIIGLKENNII
jgi:crotonobetainyl-CoA:carnitine CoA-transferase CaiB-like acyl-CoA transferase